MEKVKMPIKISIVSEEEFKGIEITKPGILGLKTFDKNGYNIHNYEYSDEMEDKLKDLINVILFKGKKV